MDNFLPLLLGTLLIVGGVFGRRFTIGLHGREAVSAWYGRTWLVGNGVFFVAAATARILKPTSYAYFLANEKFWSRSQCFFLAFFETYNGVGLMVAGLIGAVYFFRKREWKLFWLTLAAAVAGEPFAYDGLWSLFNSCWP